MLQAKLSAYSAYSFTELCRLVKAKIWLHTQLGKTMINS